jgi:hypothetical protein
MQYGDQNGANSLSSSILTAYLDLWSELTSFLLRNVASLTAKNIEILEKTEFKLLEHDESEGLVPTCRTLVFYSF